MSAGVEAYPKCPVCRAQPDTDTKATEGKFPAIPRCVHYLGDSREEDEDLHELVQELGEAGKLLAESIPEAEGGRAWFVSKEWWKGAPPELMVSFHRVMDRFSALSFGRGVTTLPQCPWCEQLVSPEHAECPCGAQLTAFHYDVVGEDEDEWQARLRLMREGKMALPIEWDWGHFIWRAPEA